MIRHRYAVRKRSAVRAKHGRRHYFIFSYTNPSLYGDNRRRDLPVMNDEIAIGRGSKITRRAGIDAENTFNLLNGGAVRMTVEHSIAITFLCMSGKTEKPRLHAIFVPMTAQNTYFFRFNDVFVHAIGKIAVALHDIRLIGIFA